MTNSPGFDVALHQLGNDLATQLKLEERWKEFDMDDGPERHNLQSFPLLQDALFWLDENVTESWRKADQQAMNSQSHHRLLARICISAGTAAILLAVLQLALQSKPEWRPTAARLEFITVLAALVAVVVGLIAKYNRRWLGKRHLAERLRMLKFRALSREELCCGDLEMWKKAVGEQLVKLDGADNFEKVNRWSQQEYVEPDTQLSPGCHPDAAFVRGLAVYYRLKRLDFQADYFQRRHREYERQAGGWRRLSLPLFFASVVFVLAHFAVEAWAERPGRNHNEAELGKAVGIWFVAAAAVFPIIGVGIRAWFAAFELPRSASLFAAKHRGLVHASTQLKKDSNNAEATLNHMIQDEHFLEHEHREWLRLLLDTEWFL